MGSSACVCFPRRTASASVCGRSIFSQQSLTFYPCIISLPNLFQMIKGIVGNR